MYIAASSKNDGLMGGPNAAAAPAGASEDNENLVATLAAIGASQAMIQRLSRDKKDRPNRLEGLAKIEARDVRVRSAPFVA